MIVVVVSHLPAGEESGLESEVARGACCFVVCVGGSTGPRVGGSALRQVFYCSGRTLVGGTRA